MSEKLPDSEEPLPNVVDLKPELVLAWRGLLITIDAGQMTRADAIAMLKSWEGEEPDGAA